jgi:hypothetical protein
MAFPPTYFVLPPLPAVLSERITPKVNSRVAVKELVASLEDFAAPVEELTAGLKDLVTGLEDLAASVKDLVTGLEDLAASVKDLVAGVKESVERLEEFVAGLKDLAAGLEDLVGILEDLARPNPHFLTKNTKKPAFYPQTPCSWSKRDSSVGRRCAVAKFIHGGRPQGAARQRRPTAACVVDKPANPEEKSRLRIAQPFKAGLFVR